MDLYVPVCGGVWATGLSCVCLIQHCLFVSDAAYVAREKAKADADYYSAAKVAEANSVKNGVGTVSYINTLTQSNRMALKLISWRYKVFL